MSSASISKTLKTTSTSKLITLAEGCFWGVERIYRKYFDGKGLIDIRVGYANGNPSVGEVTYQKVCSGSTNFAESVQISYDQNEVSTEEILEIFFRTHDPTTLNAQGPDVGTQYRSAIFVHDNDQLKKAIEIKEKMQKEWYPNHKIVTIIEPIQTWHDAEEYHQLYLQKNPEGYECPSHFLRTKPKA